MRNLLIISFLLALFPALQAQEKVYTVDNLPKVHVLDKHRYVVNPDGILSVRACAVMDAMLDSLEQRTGIESVVAAVGSIGDADAFDFCHQLLNQWGVGKKDKDNGLVILFVKDKRRIQFYTGYGLEGPLPDAICKRIQTQVMIPYFKQGDYDGGMVAGVQAACQRLADSMTNDGGASGGIGSLSLGLILLLVLGVAGAFMYMNYRASRRGRQCPQCGKDALQRIDTRLVSCGYGVRTEDVTYRCARCGQIVVRREETPEDDHHHTGGGSGWGGFLTGMMIGSLFRGGGGGHSGGGFGGGGSFGGGEGGGGGAGSDW